MIEGESYITAISHFQETSEEDGEVIVGTSDGWLHTFEMTKKFTGISQGTSRRVCNGALTAIVGARISTNNHQTMKIVAAASDEGVIDVLDEKLGELHIVGPFFIEDNSKRKSGDPVTSIKMMKNNVIAAFASGHIRVIDPRDGNLRCEIAAHARCITSMDVDPERDLVASVSEDTFLCVHSIDLESELDGSNEDQVSLLICEEMPDNICTGVRFVPGIAQVRDRPVAKVIAITFYDKEFLVLVTSSILN